MNQVTLLTLLTLVVGGLSAMQVGLNGLLGKALAHPLKATAVNFTVGALVLLTLVSTLQLLRPGLVPPWLPLPAVPWFYYAGGVLGAIFVLSTIVAGPVIGATLFAAAIVSGQAIVSVVLDHYGWLGFPQHPVSVGRVAGIVLLLSGLVLIRKF